MRSGIGYRSARVTIRVAHTELDLVGRAIGAPRRPMRMLEETDRLVLDGFSNAFRTRQRESNRRVRWQLAELRHDADHSNTWAHQAFDCNLSLGVDRRHADPVSGPRKDKIVKFGVLEDQSGLYADATGAGSTLAAQMAVEDSGLLDKGVEY